MVIKKDGFTLIEVLIGFSILVILVVVLTTTLNPIVMMNRGRDATRKKDLNKIKIAFEEYYSDKGTYPIGEMYTILIDPSSCGSKVFQPWMNTWPCDPNGRPYYIFVETDSNGFPSELSRWFKVVTNLEDKKDNDIPKGWYQMEDAYYVGPYTVNDVNYGVSSTNVNWYDSFLDPSCRADLLDRSKDYCFRLEDGDCKSAPSNSCNDDNCYSSATVGSSCEPICKVGCCGAGCY